MLDAAEDVELLEEMGRLLELLLGVIDELLASSAIDELIDDTLLEKTLLLAPLLDDDVTPQNVPHRLNAQSGLSINGLRLP